MKIDFENIEKKFETAVNSSEYRSLVSKVNSNKKIFLLGNGGLHYVASHMSTDMSRLIPDKSTYSFDSVGFITSNANDHGFESLFVRWLETIALVENPKEVLVVGMSCSGNSSNIVSALAWAQEKGMDTFMISGKKSESLGKETEELICGCDYFHTTEIMCMMLFYDIVHQTGNSCPSIQGERERMKDSPLRSL